MRINELEGSVSQRRRVIHARATREDPLTDGQQTRGADMMGLDNPIHIAFLLIVLLLVFGAKRLPEMGHSLGTGLRGFKDAIGGESAHPPLGTHEQSQPLAQPLSVQPTDAQPSVAQPAGPQPVRTQALPVQPLVASVPDDRAA
jgi:sec-independent protein translocase protein TatA